MNWQQQIKHYIPCNEQEQKDQQILIKAMKTFDDMLSRNNEIIHMTCSGFILNEARDHVLMIHHNIYDAWGWTGGHADGESDFLQVARREVEEETGIKQLRTLSEEIISLDVLTVMGHIKKGEFISPHLHGNVTYVFVADDTQTLTIKEDENSDVAWIPVNGISKVCNEVHMIPIYEKILKKVAQM